MSSKLAFFDASQIRMWQGIRGWLLPEAAEALYCWAGKAPRSSAFVEIGSYAGKSTAVLAKQLQDSGESPKTKLVAIDPRFQPDFFANLSMLGLSELVCPVESTSLDVLDGWDESVGFLYIDGHHGKGHSIADLLVWDLFTMPGSVVALDDTAGFMVGPNLQLEIALHDQAYELVEECGGISFLVKHKSLLPICERPPTKSTFFSALHAASAWSGGFDPLFRTPRYHRARYPLRALAARIWDTTPRQMASLVSRKLRSAVSKRSRGLAHDSEGVSPEAAQQWTVVQRWAANVNDSASTQGTVSFLTASFKHQQGQDQAALQLFSALSQLPQSVQFVHYRIAIRELALLRLAQCFDFLGDRDRAVSAYEKCLTESELPEIRTVADASIRVAATRNSDGEILLRSYNLWLSRYRIPASAISDSAGACKQSL